MAYTRDMYPTASLWQAAHAACLAVPADASEDWDAESAAEARRLTLELGMSWEFSTWAHAAMVVADEAQAAGVEV